MHWTKNEVLDFIQLYQKEDVLWNRKHPNHFHKSLKQDAWEDIGKKMGKSGYECRKKMEHLLASLRREKMKIVRSARAGTGTQAIYKSRWFAFDSMKFLLDRSKHIQSLAKKIDLTIYNENTRKDLDQVDGLVEVIENKVLKEVLEKSQESTSRDTTWIRSPESTTICFKKKQKTARGLDDSLDLQTDSENHLNDDSYHFGNFIASKLRLYDYNLQSVIQCDILNMFMQHSKTSCSKSPLNDESVSS